MYQVKILKMQKKVLLHITTWYPNRTDEQLGVFIQKHIQKVFTFSENIVLAIIPCSTKTLNKIEVSKQVEGNSIVIKVLYPESSIHKFLSIQTRQKAIRLGLEKVNELKIDFDFIQCHVAEVSLWIAFKFFPQKPVYLIEHWSGFIDGRFEKIPTFVRKALIKRMNKCNHIFVVSELLKQGILEKGISTSLSVLPNVIDYERVKSEPSVPFTFGVVADLIDSVKNISGIISAFSRLLKNNPHLDIHLSIIGDGTDKNKLIELVFKLDLIEKVTFYGRLNNNDVLNIIPLFDVLVVNSYVETFSMVTAEALLSGVPVIATKCGGPEQFIQQGINGYLVNVSNADELTNAMLMSIQNENFKLYDSISDEISSKLDVTELTKTIIHQLT